MGIGDGEIEGGCLCGAVRYSAEAELINARVCHCRICQRAIGAAFNARLLFRIDDVAIEGPVATIEFHAGPPARFCPVCGTTMFSRRDSRGILGVTSGSLDDPSLFKPDMHFWTASKQSWLMLEDGLPQYEARRRPESLRRISAQKFHLRCTT
ncbi:GFA family protein [Mesorhizobium atlanticum]